MTTVQTFDGAQTFYVDSSTVNGASQVMISSVDLFFKHKPQLNTNFSGMLGPGVTIFIAETMYGVPRITRDSGIYTNETVARLGYFAIQTSSNATVPTKFRFSLPVPIETDKEYALIWRFDGSDQFVLWKSVQGENLVGTTTRSAGPSGKFTGSYFDFFNMFIDLGDNDLDEYLKNWRPISDTDLKFNIYIARYAHNGHLVGANSSIGSNAIIGSASTNNSQIANATNLDIGFNSYEYITFNQDTSIKNAFIGGQNIFQNTVPYPGGFANNKTYHSVNCVANSLFVTAATNLPNGAVFSWTNIFTANSVRKHLVFKSGSTYNVRRIVSINSNTQIEVDEPLTFTNATSAFMITPTGVLSFFNKNSPFGTSESILNIANSSANSTVRFVNNSIDSVAITGGGSGYSNDDILYVGGFEDIANKVYGGYMAKANLVTNATGGITTLHFANLGCGFVNTATMFAVVANSTSGNTTGNTSGGTGATFAYTVGSTLLTELTSNIFRGIKVRNLDIGEFFPYLEVRTPSGTGYNFQIDMPYYKVADLAVAADETYHVSTNAAANRISMDLYATNYTEFVAYTPIMPSKSNEYIIRYENGNVNDKITNADSYGSVAFRLLGNTYSNSDYTCVSFHNYPSVHFSKYIVNNDATNEHTDSGNAWAKHITKTFPFTRPAEDIRVYVTAYEPANSELKVYARVYKNEDPDSFDDKNWTLLEKKGSSAKSSQADTSDYVEIEYGFFQYPQDRTALTGVAKTVLSSATVTGSGTTWESDLAVGSVILLRQELFPENHVVAVVSSIASNTSLTLTEAISNTSLVAEGLKIEKINLPYQAYNNIQKDNVARYHNSSITKFDGYDSAAIKVVFLSDTPHRVPRIDTISVVGTSA